MKKLRAAVVGCGAIAHHCHIPGYLNNKNCELAAIVDPSTKNVKQAKEAFGIETSYRTIDDLFKKEEIDVISICSPNKFHAEHILKSLEKGCHILAEKPLCLTLDEANQIEKAAKNTDVKIMVAFTQRFYKGNQKAKQWIEKGKIGHPYMIRLRFAHEGPMSGWAMSNWFHNPDKAGGGALFDMGIHAIDLATYLMGPIRKVNGMIGTLGKKIDLEDNAILQFEFEDKALGYAEVGWTSKQGFAGVEIYGSEAAIIVDYIDGVFFVQGKTHPSGKRTVRKRLIEKNVTVGGWDVEVDHFVKCIRNNVEPEAGLQTGIYSMKVALGAYSSATTGKTAEIK